MAATPLVATNSFAIPKLCFTIAGTIEVGGRASMCLRRSGVTEAAGMRLPVEA